MTSDGREVIDEVVILVYLTPLNILLIQGIKDTTFYPWMRGIHKYMEQIH